MTKVLTSLTVVYLCLWLASCSKSNGENTQKIENYQVTSPIIIDTTYHVDYVADIQSVRNVEIRARVKGYIESIYVDEGKPVRKGQILFSISKNEFQEGLYQAKAMLKSAIADAKAAELTVQNTRLLLDKNVVSKTELEMANAKLDALKAKIDEARSHEASAEIRLARTNIRAPFDGIIDRIPNKAGSLVDEGTLLTTISDNSEVFAYFNVSEKEYLDYAADKKQTQNREVSLILANGEEHKSKGRIETLEGEFNAETGSIAFRARFSNAEKILKNGSTGKVRLLNKIENALVIPQKSSFEIQDKIYVYVVGPDGTVKMKNFTPKLRIPHLYVLQAGLGANDKFIYEGIQNIREGAKVKPQFVQMNTLLPQILND
ncbi:MAG: efflux RND transporter periplasmic adaptor subunit [Runella slithyformis]|jgi:RND family efflux transporter MFP subunit|nr:MAG: efflux RND transporter periplasmic adaptor subunit [Runella slithyformis]TAE99912.1 MAG: efflux RND transporter periplasmic adaptor subunit [Runella slithyformis]TAF29959.1 MAG: efflux RND transporter periplasmic adaptor subunit [Runella slithyformis]TAF49075.1 MAG: efflux RND transporter periplasmic adaptor subunit [Runella slithyformis]TAF83570.1 MAG: efflux RND transporter periplasmic adaptor subunit [Runella slithyformis]